jgi:hypothetical protein
LVVGSVQGVARERFKIVANEEVSEKSDNHTVDNEMAKEEAGSEMSLCKTITMPSVVLTVGERVGLEEARSKSSGSDER